MNTNLKMGTSEMHTNNTCYLGSSTGSTGTTMMTNRRVRRKKTKKVETYQFSSP